MEGELTNIPQAMLLVVLTYHQANIELKCSLYIFLEVEGWGIGVRGMRSHYSSEF